MRNSGITLIELLIYIAIIAAVLFIITGFLWDIILGSVKESSYQEVQQNARFALTKITQEVKKATGINSPFSPGGSADSLYLIMAASHLNPTVFDVAEGKLRVTYCSGCLNQRGPYDLTSDQVIVRNISFTNLSYLDTPGTVRIEATIEHINPTNRIEYLASINLKSTVSLIQGGAAP